MKKTIIFLVVALSMMACKGPAGHDGLDGLTGKDGKDGAGTNWHTQTFNIKSSEWTLVGEKDELNSFYYAERKISELTDFVYDEGTVIGYMNTDEKNTIKNGLPYVLQLAVLDDNGERYEWTETYYFDFDTGRVNFYVTCSDFVTREKPGDRTFHVVLMW